MTTIPRVEDLPPAVEAPVGADEVTDALLKAHPVITGLIPDGWTYQLLLVGPMRRAGEGDGVVAPFEVRTAGNVPAIRLHEASVAALPSVARRANEERSQLTRLALVAGGGK